MRFGNGNNGIMRYRPGLAPRLAAGIWAWQPRAKTSMTIMRPPQHGHGRGRTREPSGSVFSRGCVSLPATAKTASNARALAMFPFAVAIGEKPVMPDAVEALRQHMQQKAPDELVRGERHGLVSLGPSTR